MYNWIKKSSITQHDYPYILFCIFLGVIIEFYAISKSSLGFDESYSYYLTQFSPNQILNYVALDVHPPLYYLILKVWAHMFGGSELALRSLSAIAMILVIPVGFFLAKELFNKKTAYISAIFLAMNPIIVRYGQEARMYALVTLFVTFASYILVLLTKKRIHNAYFLLYIASMVCAIYTHYYAFLVLPVHFILLLILEEGNLKQKIVSVVKNWKWILSQLVIVGSYIFWLPNLVKQFTKVSSGFWLPPVDVSSLASTFSQFIVFKDLDLNTNFLSVIFLVWLVLLLILFVARKNKYAHNSVYALLLIFIAFAPLFILVYSILKRPVYHDRYFIYCAVFLCIFIAAILAEPQKKLFKYIQTSCLILTLLLFIVGLNNVYKFQYPNTRELIATIEEKEQDSYTIIIASHTLLYSIEYYNPEKTLILQQVSKRGYGSMAPLVNNPDMVIDKLTSERLQGSIWIANSDKGGLAVKIPANWILEDTITTSGDIIASKYRIP